MHFGAPLCWYRNWGQNLAPGEVHFLVPCLVPENWHSVVPESGTRNSTEPGTGFWWKQGLILFQFLKVKHLILFSIFVKNRFQIRARFWYQILAPRNAHFLAPNMVPENGPRPVPGSGPIWVPAKRGAKMHCFYLSKSIVFWVLHFWYQNWGRNLAPDGAYFLVPNVVPENCLPVVPKSGTKTRPKRGTGFCIKMRTGSSSDRVQCDDHSGTQMDLHLIVRTVFHHFWCQTMWHSIRGRTVLWIKTRKFKTRSGHSMRTP